MSEREATLESIAPVIRPEELEALLVRRPEVRLLDVRTAGEYETLHIRGAYNVPLDTLGEHAAEIRAHVDEPVVLVCQSGGRARKAEEALKTAGMPNLHVLDGGMSGWVAAGKAVQRGRERWTLERQVRLVAGALVAVGGALAVVANPLYGLIPTLVGGGLVTAALTDTCAMGMVLAKLPYNRPATCDVEAMVRALRSGAAPSRAGRGVGVQPGPAAPAC